MNYNVNSFRIHDSGFHIWVHGSKDELMDPSSHKWMLRVCIELRKRGWKFMRDPKPLGGRYDKHFLKYHRYARRGDLELIMWASGIHLAIDLFQSVANQSNPNGARYDSDKMKRMPFLLNCRTRAEHNFLSAWGLANGLADHTDKVPTNAMARIERDRAKSWHWPKDRSMWPDFIERNRTQRNCIDRDQVPLNDGDERYFWHHGRLQRCRVYYNLNNMWWAVLNDTTVMNMWSGEFFSCADVSTLPRRWFPDVQQRMEGHMRRAVERGDYLRAHKLQQAIAKQFPQQKAA